MSIEALSQTLKAKSSKFRLRGRAPWLPTVWVGSLNILNPPHHKSSGLISPDAARQQVLMEKQCYVRVHRWVMMALFMEPFPCGQQPRSLHFKYLNKLNVRQQRDREPWTSTNAAVKSGRGLSSRSSLRWLINLFTQVRWLTHKFNMVGGRMGKILPPKREEKGKTRWNQEKREHVRLLLWQTLQPFLDRC